MSCARPSRRKNCGVRPQFYAARARPCAAGNARKAPCGQHHGRSKYMRLFLSRICQNVSCDDCRYRKKPRIADITQGDYWRVSKYHPEMNDNKGASVVLLNTTLCQPGQIFPRPADKDVLPLPVTPQAGVYPFAGNARADQAEGCGVGTAKRTAVRRSFRWFEVARLFTSRLSLRKGATGYAFRSFAGSAISKCLRSFGRNFRRCNFLCHFIAPGSYGSGVPYSKAKPAVQV